MLDGNEELYLDAAWNAVEAWERAERLAFWWMVLYIAAVVGLAIWTFAAPDRMLINAGAAFDLPLIGPLSMTEFLLAGPSLLIGMRIVLEPLLRRWRARARIAEDALELVHQTPELDWAHSPVDDEPNEVWLPEADIDPRALSPIKHKQMESVVSVTIYLSLPLVLAMFSWKAAALDGWAAPLAAIAVLSLLAILMQRKWRPRSGLVKSISVAVGLGAVAAVYIIGVPHRGLELIGEDFAEADLRGANLAGADFAYAVLKGATFDGADLSGASFRDAKEVPDLSGACAAPGARPVALPAEAFPGNRPCP